MSTSAPARKDSTTPANVAMKVSQSGAVRLNALPTTKPAASSTIATESAELDGEHPGEENRPCEDRRYCKTAHRSTSW